MKGRRAERGRDSSTGFAMMGIGEEGKLDFSDGVSSEVMTIAGCREEASDMVDGVARESVDVVSAGKLLELSSDGLGG